MRSILFTVATKCLMPNSFAIRACLTGLPQHPGARVDQQNRHVRVGGAGEHIAGVALVAGGVGQDVAASVGGKEAIGDVDRDALFAFGAQTVGQRCEVGDALVVGDGLQVVQRQAVGVVQKPPDQGALTVVHRPRRGDTQQLTRYTLGRQGFFGNLSVRHQK